MANVNKSVYPDIKTFYGITFTDTPYKVAINEAVELAKKFGQEESSGFINGILAKFA